MNIWAFNAAEDQSTRDLLMASLRNGKSRFGWSQDDKHDLRIPDNWTDWHSRQRFLLEIEPGDWIVHINTPTWGRCIAAQVTGNYDFDEGLECDWGIDFRHCIPIDTSSLIEFDRCDPNILPTVNLRPRQRYHRIYAADDFVKSIENLKSNKISLPDGQSPGEFHLIEKTERFLAEISALIQEMNKSKNLERFLAKVFRRIPSVINVHENGFGWGTDFGADLIVTTRTSIEMLDFENTVVVQVKSYSGSIYDLTAVDQIATAIEQYKAAAGMIVTTAEKTEQLEKKIAEASNSLNVPIDLLSGDDLARFVLRNAPDMLFRLERNR